MFSGRSIRLLKHNGRKGKAAFPCARQKKEFPIGHSRWEIVRIEGDRTDVRLTYESSDHPAVVRLIKENGLWKVGLVKTFWLRKNP